MFKIINKTYTDMVVDGKLITARGSVIVPVINNNLEINRLLNQHKISVYVVNDNPPTENTAKEIVTETTVAVENVEETTEPEEKVETVEEKPTKTTRKRKSNSDNTESLFDNNETNMKGEDE